MKSILNKEGAADLLNRANALQPASKALWGSMTITEMLHHCNRATHSILEGKAPPKKSTAKQKALKFLFLHVIKKLPKNANAPKRFNVKLSKLVPSDFENEQKEFIDLIKRFVSHKDDITLSHPWFNANIR